MPNDRVVVMIATPIEAALLRPLRAMGERLEILHEPDLLAPTRYPCDHQGAEGFRRDEAGENRFTEMLSRAEVLFGIPGGTPQGLATALRVGKRIRWIHAMVRDVSELVRAADLSDEERQRVVITQAGDVNAIPLAEFAIFGLLAFTKGLPRLVADQQHRRWDRYPVAELDGQTVLVIGLGAVGLEVARLAKALGMRVMGVSLSGRTDSEYVDRVRPPRFLADLLQVSHGVVITLPLVEETRAMIDADAIGRMHSAAVLVNVGGGGVVDEAALIDALADGRLAGAALDVFETEPLPADSPLWQMPNVIVSPHTAGLSPRENERIMALFSEDLSRYLAGDWPTTRVGHS